MKRKMLPLVFVMLAVFVAGCVGGGQTGAITTGGTGLKILSFSPDQESVFGDKTAKLTLLIENQGEFPIKDSESLIYLTGSNVNLYSSSASSTTTWINATPTDIAIKKIGKDMKAADMVRQIPADQKELRWTVKAPALARGQTKTDTFTARVYYNYTTRAYSTVWVYSETEAAAIRAAKGTFEEPFSNSTKGPIKVEISYAPSSPTVSASDNTFTMYIKLTNIGGGVAFDGTKIDYTKDTPQDAIKLGEDDLNKVNIKIIAPNGMTITGCDGLQDMTGAVTQIPCDVTITALPATKQGFSPIVDVKYGYYVDATTSITVSGK